jgi:hypothetical protein
MAPHMVRESNHFCPFPRGDQPTRFPKKKAGQKHTGETPIMQKPVTKNEAT